MPQLTRALLALNFQVKNYDKAIDFGQRAIKGGFATDDNKNLVAQAYYLKGNFKDSLQDRVRAGRRADPCRPAAQGGCTEAGAELTASRSRTPRARHTRWSAWSPTIPKPEYWSNLLFSIRRQTSTNDTNTLQTYRLMNDVDVLKEADDYNEMAQLALEAGSPGEAQKVLEKGFDKGAFTEPARQGPQYAPAGDGEEDRRHRPGLAAEAGEGRGGSRPPA